MAILKPGQSAATKYANLHVSTLHQRILQDVHFSEGGACADHVLKKEGRSCAVCAVYQFFLRKSGIVGVEGRPVSL